jgi:hypothetical protein
VQVSEIDNAREAKYPPIGHRGTSGVSRDRGCILSRPLVNRPIRYDT